MYMSLVIAKIAYNCTNLKMFLAKIYTNLKITAAPSLHCHYFTAPPPASILHCPGSSAPPPRLSSTPLLRRQLQKFYAPALQARQPSLLLQVLTKTCSCYE